MKKLILIGLVTLVTVCLNQNTAAQSLPLILDPGDLPPGAVWPPADWPPHTAWPPMPSLTTTLPLPPPDYQFGIAFPGGPPPPTLGLPSGSAELRDGVFYGWLYLGYSVATYGRILERSDDGSLTPVFDFSQILFGPRPPDPSLPTTGDAFYSYYQWWQLTDQQVGSLLAGRWYAEIAFGSDIHLGQIAVVPEPASLTLLVSGAACMAALRFRRRQK